MNGKCSTKRQRLDACGGQRERAQTPPSDRPTTFLDVFTLVLAHYTRALAAAGEIDFHDMIVQATDLVRSGRYPSPFKHIIVDEFQDISRGRAHLLAPLLDQHAERRLFCVGDDWQSIYRFTGSDIGIMTEFQKQFGFTQRVDLDTTFRYPKELLEASSRFIQKNPLQLKKTLRSPQSQPDRKPIKVIVEGVSDADGHGLRRALSEIQASEGTNRAKVLVLGRYHFALAAVDTLRSQFPTLEIDGRTVHTSKGLEAEYVVVLDVTCGRYGFPAEIIDDPVLNLVLATAGRPPPAGRSELASNELPVLDSAAAFPEGASRKRIAIHSGRSINSSAFHAAFRSLESKGLLRPDGDLYHLTDAGRELAVAAGGSSLNDWLNKIEPAEAKVLAAIAGAAPRRLSREEISQLTGQSMTSSAFKAAFRGLRDLHLIEGDSDFALCEGVSA